MTLPSSGRSIRRPWGASLSSERVVREVASQGTAQVSFAKDEDVIQTFAPDGADKALRERVLPWAVRRRQNFTDAYALHAFAGTRARRPSRDRGGGRPARSRPGRRPRSAGRSSGQWGVR